MNIEYTNLYNITRDSDTARTIVSIYDDSDYGAPTKWLEFGQAQLRIEGRICWLSAYLTEGVTDFEHDSAYALRLPLIGVKFDGVNYHSTRITAWIDPNNPDDFRVPRPLYNPMNHPEAYNCEYDNCKDEPHVVVPEGFYVPPFDEELYEAVRGKRIDIIIGPRR